MGNNNNCRFYRRNATDRDIYWDHSAVINFQKRDKAPFRRIPFAATNGFNFLFALPRAGEKIGRILEALAAYRNVQTRNPEALLRFNDRRISSNNVLPSQIRIRKNVFRSRCDCSELIYKKRLTRSIKRTERHTI